MLKRWPAFTRFLEDGRICLSNNAAERALRGIALGRKSWLFAGSGEGGRRATAMYSIIVTAKMNDVDPQSLACPFRAGGPRHVNPDRAKPALILCLLLAYRRRRQERRPLLQPSLYCGPARHLNDDPNHKRKDKCGRDADRESEIIRTGLINLPVSQIKRKNSYMNKINREADFAQQYH